MPRKGVGDQVIAARPTRYEREAPTDARAAWTKLSKSNRLEIAAEIVVSRGEELRQAFPASIGIAYGFRTSGESTGPDDHRSPLVDPD